MKRKIIFIITLVFVSLLIACDSDSAQRESEYIKLPVSDAEIQGLEDFKTLTIDGKKVDQSIFKGHKVTLVKAWLTTCPPCIEGLRQNEKIYQRFKGKDFNMVGVVANTLDRGCQINSPRAYRDIVKDADGIITDNRVTFDNLILPYNAMYGIVGEIPGYPAYFYVDEEGKPISGLLPHVSYEERVKQIEKLLDN